MACAGGRLAIVREGTVRKFLPAVEQISFNAERARSLGQEVLYVTERAVFRLSDGGLELIEVAPGIDVQRQILDLLPFAPLRRQVRTMSAAYFSN